MRRTNKLIALLLCLVMLLGMMPTVFAADGAPVPTDQNANAQWEEVQRIISQYYGEWTDTSYPGAVNIRIPNTALLGNGDVGVSSAGSSDKKSFYISKGDFWEYNNAPLPAGTISIGEYVDIDEGNIAPTSKNVTASSTDVAFPDPRAAVNGQWRADSDYQGWVSQHRQSEYWLKLEFESEISFDRWVVRNDNAGRPGYPEHNTKACAVQISADGNTWTTVSTVSNNVADVIDITMDQAVVTKWVRLLITEPTQASTSDTQINPRARVGAFELYNTNLALQYKQAYQSSVMDNNPNHTAAAAVNGKWCANYQGWVTNVLSGGAWMMLDMGEEITFNRWVVRNDGAARPYPYLNTRACELQIWTGSGEPDGTEETGWKKVDGVQDNTANVIDRNLSENCAARYIRLYISESVQPGQSNPRARIGSFELYHEKAPEPTNVAKGKTVYTCDVYNNNYTGDKMVDGVIEGETKWCCNKAACADNHWAILDLQNEYVLTSCKIAHSGAMGSIYEDHNTVDFQLQYLGTTEDMTQEQLEAADWKVAATVNDNQDTYTTTSFGSGVVARYVRLHITDASDGGTDQTARINELELYGYAVPQSTNVALNSDVYVCGKFNDNYDGDKMVDGVIEGEAKWCCTNTACGKTHWAILDMKNAYTLTSFKMANSGAMGPSYVTHDTVAFQLQYLETTEDMTKDDLEAAEWKVAVDVPDNKVTYTTGEFPSGVTARYVRLYITNPAASGDNASRINELELYGYQMPGFIGDDGEETTSTLAFNEKQDILNAEVVTRQQLADTPMEIHSWMSATNNLFVMEVKSLEETGAAPAEISINLEAFVGGSRPTTAEVGEDYMLVTRTTNDNSGSTLESDTDPYISKVAMATRVIGAEAAYEDLGDDTATMTVTLPAGGTAYVVTAICGGGRTYDVSGNLWVDDGVARTEPTDEALTLLNTIEDAAGVEDLHKDHLNWWKDYWMQSYISLDIDDPDLATLQKYYYAAQYELGSSIRDGNIAAGLYGIWHTTDNSGWHSDYHLNYNFISTYYGLPTSNRVSMVKPAVDAIMDYIPQGIQNAGSITHLDAVDTRDLHLNKLIEQGKVDPQKGIENAVLYPVSIGPYGMTLEYLSYHGETLDAPFSAYPLIEYYNFTQDKDFMEDTLYVYLEYVLNFLEHWLVEEDGKYVLYAAYNEGSWAKNAALEINAYKMCLKYGIQIAEELGDNVKADKWQNIYDKMADPPIVEDYNGTGKTILGLADEYLPKNSSTWTPLTNVVGLSGGNALPLEVIVPFEELGYYSTDEELTILQNTVDAYSSKWAQINSFPKIPVAAVNSRYDCHTIVTKLASVIRSQMKKNLMIDDGTHGIEKAGATEAINNMMLLSDQGVIKLFGNWLADKDAKFVRLRAPGAFVFSAEYDGDTKEIVEGATMYSEAGATATVASLWAEGMTVLDSEGNLVKTIKGTAPNHEDEITYTFETKAGETYTFKKGEAPISVTGVTLDQTALELAAGEEATLTATVEPSDATDPSVTWSTSNEDVAAVENGKVTAVGKGEATITVTTNDGGKTADCAVTVTLDTSAIDNAINAAEAAKEGIAVNDNEEEAVASGTKFVTTAEMKALNDAIAAAEDAKEEAKTPADVTDAVEALEKAVEDFEAAIKTGSHVPVNKEALADAISRAKALAAETYTEESWVALEAALTAAESVAADEEATQEEVNAAVEALETAIDALEAAEEPETKVEINEDGISEVPDTLTEEFESVEELEEAIVQVIVNANDKISEDNVAHYDVTLMYSEDGGITWHKADEEHFPANGKLKVTLPYPDGTDKSYTFVVAHMFTSSAFGKTPGDVEMPKVTNTDNGIVFEVTGLSPISVGWTAPVTDEPEDPSWPIRPIRPIWPVVGGSVTPVEKFPFTDVPTNAWYYDEVKEAWENDLIDGITGTLYMPDNTLTVAQAIKLAAALHQMYFEGEVTLENGAPNWYDSYVDYAIANGIIEAKYDNYTNAQMNAPISREEFVHIFYGAMDAKAYYACNTVTDNAIPDVKMNDTYADEIYTFYRAGILTGSDAQGTFNPDSNIKRSEVAAILIRMYDVDARQAVTLG